MACAEKYARIQEIAIQGITYTISAYGTATEGIVTGVIKGVPSEDNDRDIHEQIVTKYNPTTVGAKRISTFMIVIVAFASEKVPRYVCYGHTLYQCSLHHKQIEV